MWTYIHTDELYHYGVVGMKWGIRRERRQSLRAARGAYKKAKNDAFSEYERTISDIEKPYKRGQNLSKADLDRQAAAEKKYSSAVANAKQQYKQEKQQIKFDAGKKIFEVKNSPLAAEGRKATAKALKTAGKVAVGAALTAAVADVAHWLTFGTSIFW